MTVWELLAATWPGLVAGLIITGMLYLIVRKRTRREREALEEKIRADHEQQERTRDQEHRKAQREWAASAVRILEASGADCTCETSEIEEHALCELPRTITTISRHDPECPTHWPLKEHA